VPRYKRGSGSIYRKRGWWYLAYYNDGRRVSEAAKTQDRRVARDLLQRRLEEIRRGSYLDPPTRRRDLDDTVALVV
jgi:hypothetical protein